MLTVLKLLGAVALLIFGMKTMSDALQKMAGPQLRHVLGTMTTNRFTGVLTGIIVTVAVQSSTATTVMTVSFVNAGLLTLAQAISVIMGANIGTTLTAWIMSAGFSFNITNFVWPVFLIGIILINIKKRRYLGDFLFGLAFLLFALGTLNMTGREMNLAGNPAVVNFFSSFPTDSYLSVLAFLLMGSVLTFCVQSSAALMAITMVLCSTGVLPIYLGLALVLGENIGTTITANLIAMSANVQARRTALSHLVFNVFGVIWVLAFFYPFVRLVCSIVGVDPDASSQDPTRLTVVLATFHTLFNVTNTLILIWFIPIIEKFVTKVIKPRPQEDDEIFRLSYIQTGIIKTPEISVLQAQKEIGLFGDRIVKMYGMVEQLLAEENKDSFGKTMERVEKYEQITDNMEAEIGKYLSDVSKAHLSDDTKGKIRDMLREVNELESIGDSCLAISRVLKRKAGTVHLDDNLYSRLESLFAKTKAYIDAMRIKLEDRDADIDINLKKEIKLACLSLSDSVAAKVEANELPFTTGTILNDLTEEVYTLSGYVENVIEARMGIGRITGNKTLKTLI